MTPADLEFDQRHIWHPYTSMTQPLPCYPVESAQGVELALADGRKLVDGMSSWWAAIHGYNHPLLNQAAISQIGKMSHVMFGGITHPSAIALSRQLVEMTPAGLECVFLADSGSVAVEVALKMAMQYWQAKGQRRQKLLTLRNGITAILLARWRCATHKTQCTVCIKVICRNTCSPRPRKVVLVKAGMKQISPLSPLCCINITAILPR